MTSVYKFGGSSVNDIECIKSIIKKCSTIKGDIIVVSAFRDVTDLLIDLENEINNSNKKDNQNKIKSTNISNRIEEIIKYHDHVIEYFLSDIKVQIKNEIYEKVFNKAISNPVNLSILGEEISLFIMTNILKKSKIRHIPIDSSEILIFNGDHIDHEESNQRLDNIDYEDSFLLTTGYIAFDKISNQKINLGRGGSDYSAALFSEIDQKCKHVYLCSNVRGIHQIEPRIIQTPHIPVINKKIALFLSQMGCKKLNMDCMKVITKSNKNLVIQNTKLINEDNSNTTITDQDCMLDYTVFIKVNKDNFSYSDVVNSIRVVHNKDYNQKNFIIIIGNKHHVIDRLFEHQKNLYHTDYLVHNEYTVIFVLDELNDDIIKEYYLKLGILNHL